MYEIPPWCFIKLLLGVVPREVPLWGASQGTMKFHEAPSLDELLRLMLIFQGHPSICKKKFLDLQSLQSTIEFALCVSLLVCM